MNIKMWVYTWFLIAIIIPIIGGINYIIDPYGENYYFNNSGINNLKITRGGERQLKFNYLKNNSNYKSIILGNSKGAYIDPSIIKRYTGLDTYNASFSAGTMNEFLEYTKWLISQKSIKQLFIVFDFYALSEFNSNGNMPIELRQNSSIRFTYFSLSHLKDSIRTILHNMSNNKEVEKENKYYLAKGMRYDKNYFERKKSIKKQLKHIEYLKSKQIVWYGKNVSKERMNDLKEIVALCKDNNIKLFLVQGPSSYLQLNASGRKFYKKLLLLVNNISQIHPVYFFNDFNYVNNDLKYFLDNTHFNYDVNELIFERIFLEKGIGKKITSNNPIQLID